MPVSTPSWWYPTRNAAASSDKLLPLLLGPASALYGAIAGARMKRTPTYVPSIPTICIGNFTAGGTGKTPVALYVAERLKHFGAKPAFLTRGYGGTLTGPYDVDPDRDDAERAGDEPLLLARAAPTTISRDRVLGVKHLERTDTTVIVMDDGMQNPHVAKTLTLAVVDGTRGIGNGWSIPSGPLRAPLTQQLTLPDAIVLNGESPENDFRQNANLKVPVFSGQLRPSAESFNLRDTAVTAFAGIGNPERFYTTLDACGANVQVMVNFPDHHAFSDEDAQKILEQASADQNTIVTTEKDHVRLRNMPLGSPRKALYENSYALPVAFEFQKPDMARLDAMLDMVVRQSRRN